MRLSTLRMSDFYGSQVRINNICHTWDDFSWACKCVGVATAVTTSAAADCLMTSFAANYLAAEFKAALPRHSPSPCSCCSCAFAAINPLRLHILLHLPGPPKWDLFYVIFLHFFLHFSFTRSADKRNSRILCATFRLVARLSPTLVASIQLSVSLCRPLSPSLSLPVSVCLSIWLSVWPLSHICVRGVDTWKSFGVAFKIIFMMLSLCYVPHTQFVYICDPCPMPPVLWRGNTCWLWRLCFALCHKSRLEMEVHKTEKYEIFVSVSVSFASPVVHRLPFKRFL